MTSGFGRRVAKPSALLTTLLVMTTTSPSCGDACARIEVGQIGACRDFADAVDRDELDVHRRPSSPASWSASSASFCVFGGSVIHSGTARTAIPSCVDRWRSAASQSSMSQPSRMPVGRAAAVKLSHPACADLDAQPGEQLVGHAPYRRAADDRRDPDDGRRGRTQCLAGCRGTPTIGPTDTTGFDGGTRTTSAWAIASITPGAAFALLDADDVDRVNRHLGAVANPELLEVNAPSFAVDRRVDVRLDRVVGHRQQADVPASGRYPQAASAHTAVRSPH